MPEENMNQKFRLRKIDEIRNYLFEIAIGIASSTKGLKICVITTAIKKYKSIIKKKRKKYNKIVLLAKSKLDKLKF